MSFSLVIIIILMLSVIFVNGWTDAPNAIATAVSTRTLSPALAVRMAILFNFLGALVMTFINKNVAATISNIVKFEGHNQDPLIVLAAAMFSIVLWAVLAWCFGIPTSESHALIAGVTGGAFALGGFSSINGKEWMLVIYGLVISSILGFVLGYINSKLIEFLFCRMKRKTANKVFNVGQTCAAVAMAFMHGAQDGQKFMGICMLGIYLYNSNMVSISGDNFNIPIWMIVLCSVVMGIGTSAGGYRIIKAVGMDMVKLEKYQGFAADTAASFCLLLSSVFGIPISTTHTKTTAIMGVGASRRLSSVNWIIVNEMIIAWILTFPCCGIIAFFMAKLFIMLFS